MDDAITNYRFRAGDRRVSDVHWRSLAGELAHVISDMGMDNDLQSFVKESNLKWAEQNLKGEERERYLDTFDDDDSVSTTSVKIMERYGEMAGRKSSIKGEVVLLISITDTSANIQGYKRV